MKTISINISDFNHLEYCSSSPSGLIYKHDIFTGKNYKLKRKNKGDIAGAKSIGGYWVIAIKNKRFLSHRVVLALHGVNIEGIEIDHIDGNQDNNSIENLRLANRAINTKNRKMPLNNKSGVCGVRFVDDKKCPRWVAQWKENGKNKMKSFAVNKYKNQAFDLAVDFRKKIIWQLKERGHEYTERHGS